MISPIELYPPLDSFAHIALWDYFYLAGNPFGSFPSKSQADKETKLSTQDANDE